MNSEAKETSTPTGLYIKCDDSMHYDGGYNGVHSGLKFQFITKPTESGGNEKTVVCGRLLTNEGTQLNGTGACGVEWGNAPTPKRADNLTAYQQVASELLRYLDSTVPPQGKVSLWDELQFYAYRFSSALLVSPATPQQDASPYQMSSDQLSEAGRQQTRAIFARKRALHLGSLSHCPEEQKTCVEGSRAAPPELQTQTSTLGWWGRHVMHDTDQITLAKQYNDPTREFRQQLEIWAQPFKFAGISGGTEHSAVYGLIQSRRIDSNEPWVYVDEWFSQNHGARPGLGNMKLKRTCLLNELPVTKGYYITGGECDGSWLQDHVCNDDTAYQIRSAHGIWTKVNGLGEGVCRGRRRWNPPTRCSVPW